MTQKPTQTPGVNAPVSRRSFLTYSAGAAAVIGCPSVLTASRTLSNPMVGEGDYKYAVKHEFPELPSQYKWQTTHNVAVDSSNNLYVIHEGREKLKDHPSIFVFDEKGKFIRAFGNQFQGGGHGIEVRKEGSEEYLYVCSYQQVKSFAKMTLKGETVWEKYAPMKAGVYAENEDKVRRRIWGRNRFMPTNFAFLDDGGFLLADGYGSFHIHRYDKDANYVSTFGGPGKGKGKFNTPHGIWIDRRPGRKPAVVICDRANHTLQYLSMKGEYQETLTGYGLPANVDTYKDLMLVPELVARVTLLNAKNEVVARLGEDIERVSADKKRQIRSTPAMWKDGRFVHPHDACFDREGNIFVAEWVGSGRVTKLTRV